MDTAPVPNLAFSGAACFSCFKPATTSTIPRLSRCSSCRIVKYCSQACAARDWKDHKSFCRSMQAIRTTLAPPPAVVILDDDEDDERRDGDVSKQRRTAQKKVWLTEDELLETALKRRATMLESKLLWRESRCAVCSDRECDVERRPTTKEKNKGDYAAVTGWRVCHACRVVAYCCERHEEVGKTSHRGVKDVDGMTQCEAVVLSNEIDEFFLRQHLANSAAATAVTPSLWVPNRILSNRTRLPASWSEYLSSVSKHLPSPTPPLAEIYGVFVEALSPVLTILSSLDRLGFLAPETDDRLKHLTLYLLDESLETCSNWIPCLEELQHQLPALDHVEIVTVSPVPPRRASSSSESSTIDDKGKGETKTQLSSVTKLPMCPECTRHGRTRTITHRSHLADGPTPTRTRDSRALAVSFNSSIALATDSDARSNPTTFWAQTLATLFGDDDDRAWGRGGGKPPVPLVVTSQTREEADDTFEALVGPNRDAHEVDTAWKVERNAWRGGWGRVEGWWGLEKKGEDEGEGIVWKNAWSSAVVARSE